ncbi:hypothetical protein DOY81_008437, partial [Sarcophaga bullata]
LTSGATVLKQSDDNIIDRSPPDSIARPIAALVFPSCANHFASRASGTTAAITSHNIASNSNNF